MFVTFANSRDRRVFAHTVNKRIYFFSYKHKMERKHHKLRQKSEDEVFEFVSSLHGTITISPHRRRFSAAASFFFRYSKTWKPTLLDCIEEAIRHFVMMFKKVNI